MATALPNYPSFQQPSSAHHAPNNLGDHARLHVEGYPKLAFFFSQCPKYLHLRRFSALAVRLLLYRQHNLTVLEKALIDLETRDSSSSETNRQLFCKDFAPRKAPSPGQNGEPDEQRELYETLKTELKEYEEALLRFDRLGSKGYDAAELRTIQWFLSQQMGSYLPLIGLDATIWGSLFDPQGHASDIIQVVEQPTPSVIGRFFREKVLLWAPDLPAWLWLLLFWSRKRPDAFRQYTFSSRAFEAVSLSLGNVVTSLLVYAAVTSLYFAAGKAASVAAVVIIAGTITICSILFRNQQFISMLATVCAVLVTLLLNDSSQRPQPTPTGS